MCHHTHLTPEEREDIMVLWREGRSQADIARVIGRHRSTISRELSRNMCAKGAPNEYYRAFTAQRRYEDRRKACKRRRLLDGGWLFSLVRDKFLGEQWSPEQIEGRLALELGRSPVSDTTIYRAIRDGLFDSCLPGRKKAACRLRHKGKRRRSPGTERRGKFDGAPIDDRPREAESRSELGHWEADTVAGVASGCCLVTLVDRRSGLIAGGKCARKSSAHVNDAIISALKEHPLKSITPDRGKEFAAHAQVTAEIGVGFYFAYPHHPWQRGTNENTNGLLREYFPKGRPIDGFSDEEVQSVYHRLNRRPRKRHGYRTPYEVHYSTTLQLI